MNADLADMVTLFNHEQVKESCAHTAAKLVNMLVVSCDGNGRWPCSRREKGIFGTHEDLERANTLRVMRCLSAFEK